MTDLRQSPYWANFMEELGWDVVKISQDSKDQYVFLRKVPLVGTLLKAPRIKLPFNFKKLDDLAAERKIFSAKIEPDHLLSEKPVLSELKNNLFKSDHWSLHPTKTVVINLRQNEDEILSNMEKDTRYSVRASQRRGIRVVHSNDINRFLKLYQQTAKRQKFWFPEKDLRLLWEIFSNEGHAFILIAQWNKTDIAGCLILHHDKTAYYYHAASLKQYSEFFAPYLLVWEAILNSKALKLKELDLEGVFDPRMPNTKKWKGFSHFKRGFRGEEKILVGSFVKNYSPVAKALYLPYRFL